MNPNLLERKQNNNKIFDILYQQEETQTYSIVNILKRSLIILVFTGILTMSSFSLAYPQVEIEADPLAYVLGGYSGHVAYVFDPLRASVGVYGIEVPQFFHGNEGWKVKSRGVTVKVDYLIPNMGGLFVGLDTGFQRSEYTLKSVNKTEERYQYGVGIRTGYRYFFGDTGFYVVPWFSVSYRFRADDVEINGERFELGRIQIFPTIHLGWQF